MKIEIQLLSTSQPIVHTGVTNSYQKGDLFCVYVDGTVYKYPMQHIFRVKEDYAVKPVSNTEPKQPINYQMIKG